MKNFSLNSMDEIYSIEKRSRTKETGDILPVFQQKIFAELHELSGKDYRDKLKELKCHWDLKVKLTNETI